MGIKKEFNNHKIINDAVIIYLERMDGTIYETIIDLEDLEYVKSLDLHWHLFVKQTGDVYAHATKYNGIINGKRSYSTFYLSQKIMRTDVGCIVDHKDHNTLDNRKSNLRITETTYNLKNRETRNKNNTTGFRNVCFFHGEYVVQLQINGKNKVLGKFKDVDDAGQFAEQMRQKYYGEFAGNN